jgi:ABC-2 type transport system permease protein
MTAPGIPRLQPREEATAPGHPSASGIHAWWRGLRTAFWLGWQVDSNWTDPWLFFIYSIARPLGGALILVFMYFAVTAGGAGPQEGLLAFFVVGTAFWPMVLGGTQGMAQTVVEDREQWRVTRYVYTAPVPWASYLVGRALARGVSLGLPAAVVTLVLAVVLLDVPLVVTAGGLAYTLVVLVLGLGAILAVGLVAVAVAVTVAGEAWRFPEAVSAALYLVSGAIFPPSLLPGPLQKVAAALPLTWWIEGLRRGLTGEGARVGYPAVSDSRVLLVLAALTLAWGIAASAMFKLADRRARRFGILDRESSY